MNNIDKPQHIEPIEEGAVAPPPEKLANLKILVRKILGRK